MTKLIIILMALAAPLMAQSAATSICSISTSGVLSCPADQPTTFNFKAQVCDTEQPPVCDAKPFQVTIVGTVAITTITLPLGKQGTAYSMQLTASGGTGVYTWSLVAPPTLIGGEGSPMPVCQPGHRCPDDLATHPIIVEGEFNGTPNSTFNTSQ